MADLLEGALAAAIGNALDAAPVVQRGSYSPPMLSPARRLRGPDGGVCNSGCAIATD